MLTFETMLAEMNGASASSPSILNGIGELLKLWGKCLGNTFLHGVVWGIAGLFLGAIIGFGLYWFIQRKGGFVATWNWYRYFRWLWPVIFIVCICIGIGLGGMIYGAGRELKAQVVKDKIIDQTLYKVYAAAFWFRKSEMGTGGINGELLEQDFEKLIAELESLGRFSEGIQESVKSRIIEQARKSGVGKMKIALLEKGLDWFVQQQIDKAMKEEDYRLFIAVALGSKLPAEKLRQGRSVADSAMGQARAAAGEAISGAVNPYAALFLACGLGIPLFLFGFFRLLVHFTRKKVSPGLPPQLL